MRRINSRRLKILFLALCAFVLCVGFGVEIFDSFSLNLLFFSIFIALSTFFIYSLPTQIKFDKINFQFLFSFLFLVICGFFLVESLAAFIVLGLIFLISFLYVSSVPFLNLKLRNIPYFKGFLIAFSWVTVCFVFPTLNYLKSVNYNMISASFCFFLALTIPFDIRDFKLDKGKVKTIVGRFDVLISKLFSGILLCIAAYLSHKCNFNSFKFWSLVVVYAYLLVLVFFTKKNFSSVFWEILLDSSILLLGIAYFL